MEKIKKKYILFLSVFFLLGIIVGLIIIVYFSKKAVIPKSVNVFGEPREQTNLNFPVGNPEFTAVIGKIKPANVHQQSITVYQISSKTKVFERSFYADGFRGDELTYAFASNSAEITQSGSIGSLGCSDADCTLLWSNYYLWNPTQQTFVLNNTAHKNEFQYLLEIYQKLDQKGCSIVTKTVISEQSNMSFTELYKKYPTAKYYCSNQQGILPGNLTFFLQAEKTLQEVINGDTVGSDDIRNVST